MRKSRLIMNSALALIIVFLAVVCGLLYSNNSMLKNQLRERDDYLNSIVSNDSLGIIQRDSLINRLARAVFIVGDQEFTGEQFLQYTKELISQYNLTIDSLYYYKTYYEMTQKVYEVKFSGKKNTVGPVLDSDEWEYSISYPETDTLNSLEITGFVSRSNLLKHLSDRYDINVFDYENGRLGYDSPKIDSALLLLPYYRDKLSFIPDKNSWTITLPGVEKRLLDAIVKKYKIDVKEVDGYYTTSSPQLDSALMLLPYFRNNLKYDAESQSWIVTHYGENKK